MMGTYAQHVAWRLMWVAAAGVVAAMLLLQSTEAGVWGALLGLLAGGFSLRGRGRTGDGSGGTAALANVEMLRRAGLIGARSGFYLGVVQGRFRLHRVMLPSRVAEQNVLVVGQPGAGKTRGILEPLLRAEVGRGRTVIVFDPKLELFARTAPYLAATHRVGVYAPLRPEISLRYDPLAHVRTSVDAQTMAKEWVDATGRSAMQPFHDSLEEALLTAALIYCRSLEGATIQTVRCFLLQTETNEMLEHLRAYQAAHREDQVLADAVGTLGLLVRNDETLVNVLSGFGRRFNALAIPEVIETTTGNDVEIAALVERPSILFVSIPFGHVEALRPLSANFCSTLLRELQQYGGPNAELPRPVRLIFEEFANIGKITRIVEALTTLRGKRVSITLVLQTLSQLAKLYSEEGEAIRNACGTQVVLGGAAQEDAEYFSRRAGPTTVRTVQDTHPWHLPFPTTRSSRGRGYRERPLLTPDEVRRLANQALVVSGHTPPCVIGLPFLYPPVQPDGVEVVRRVLAYCALPVPADRLPGLNRHLEAQGRRAAERAARSMPGGRPLSGPDNNNRQRVTAEMATQAPETAPPMEEMAAGSGRACEPAAGTPIPTIRLRDTVRTAHTVRESAPAPALHLRTRRVAPAGRPAAPLMPGEAGTAAPGRPERVARRSRRRAGADGEVYRPGNGPNGRAGTGGVPHGVAASLPTDH